MSRAGEFHPFEPPGPGARVLVLGDLGCLQTGADELQGAWANWGQSSREAGCHPFALVPCADAYVPALLRQVFAVASGQKLPRTLVGDPIERQDAIERLLRLVAPAVRLEPGLLREIRNLLPGDAAADASLESAVWQHPVVVSRHSVAATLDPGQAKDVLLPQFASEGDDLRRAVLTVIRTWRKALDPLVWFQEVDRLPTGSRAFVPP
jgi:hypothetical protein